MKNAADYTDHQHVLDDFVAAFDGLTREPLDDEIEDQTVLTFTFRPEGESDTTTEIFFEQGE